MHYDVFNGDADGILSLLQLRLSDPKPAKLISGIKRDIALLERVPLQEVSSVTVLDISMDKNRAALNALLAHQVPVTYIDHHKATQPPESVYLTRHIDLDANTCTALIVNDQLAGQHRLWAITAAYGDNMIASAESLADKANLSDVDRHFLRQLGTLVNYNGYGEKLEDLHVSPVDLYQQLLRYRTPFACREDAYSPYYVLLAAFEKDQSALSQATTLFDSDTLQVVSLPATAAARRMSGTYINELANRHPSRAHITLVEREQRGSDGQVCYTVSVRAPLNNKQGAAAICSQFDTGGGREAAGGINQLPRACIQRLIDTALAYYQ
ncbi:DHH family phosphoesterase [Vibrio cionasavignyae]|uniref:DHH family phosphoesterase n=1 Tax=Vibrio cionasavignyae TaxID=2910252 RepID=UPI003D12F99B